MLSNFRRVSAGGLKMAREFFDRQKALWAYVRRSEVANEKLVIFVHGFGGSYLSTWGELANYLTNHADADEKLKTWDYLFVGYETYSIDTYLAIAGLVASQWKKASMGQPPFDRNKYSTLAIFAHSLGTLGVRQLLCAMSKQPEGLAKALRAAVLFGSPLNGSPLAGMGGLRSIVDLFTGKPAAILPKNYRIARALEPGSPELEMLNVWSKTMRKYGRHPFGPTKVILGTDDHVVGRGGLAEWDDDDVVTTAMDHSGMVKITNEGNATQGFILDELRGLP
jgi:pimeloyl-ACP methyl ester carboxylesterase